MKKHGFSLLELAIVMLIGGMMMSSLISLMNSVASNSKSRANIDKLNSVKLSFTQFFQKNNRLPCPANPTLDSTNPQYGVESINQSTGLCDYTLTLQGVSIDAGFKNHILSGSKITRLGVDQVSYAMQDTIKHKIIFGTIPFKTLGVSQNYMYDEYNNKITYITAQGYATNRFISTSPMYKKMSWTRIALPSKFYQTKQICSMVETQSSLNDNICTEIISSNCLSATDENPLIINTLVADGFYRNDSGIHSGDTIINTCRMDLQDYSKNYITRENLAYALISHGKNGLGAWNKSGTLNDQPISLQEKENTFQYYHTTYPTHDLTLATNSIKLHADTIKPDFDDDVLYQKIDDLLFDTGRTANIYCHQSTTFIDIDPNYTRCFIWHTYTQSTRVLSFGKMAILGEYCSSDLQRYLDCSAGGLWVNPT